MAQSEKSRRASCVSRIADSRDRMYSIVAASICCGGREGICSAAQCDLSSSDPRAAAKKLEKSSFAASHVLALVRGTGHPTLTLPAGG